MTTYADAEQARWDAVKALRTVGLTAEADRLAACPPIVERKTADATRAVLFAAHDAAERAARPYNVAIDAVANAYAVSTYADIDATPGEAADEEES